MAANEQELKGLMKKNKGTLFDDSTMLDAGDSCQVNLAAGILLYGKEWKISLHRNALAKVEELGYNDAIKISKSLDRSVIETWPIEKLFMIGGKKRLVEKFDWEVFET